MIFASVTASRTTHARNKIVCMTPPVLCPPPRTASLPRSDRHSPQQPERVCCTGRAGRASGTLARLAELSVPPVAGQVRQGRQYRTARHPDRTAESWGPSNVRCGVRSRSVEHASFAFRADPGEGEVLILAPDPGDGHVRLLHVQRQQHAQRITRIGLLELKDLFGQPKRVATKRLHQRMVRLVDPDPHLFVPRVAVVAGPSS